MFNYPERLHICVHAARKTSVLNHLNAKRKKFIYSFYKLNWLDFYMLVKMLRYAFERIKKEKLLRTGFWQKWNWKFIPANGTKNMSKSLNI